MSCDAYCILHLTIARAQHLFATPGFIQAQRSRCSMKLELVKAMLLPSSSNRTPCRAVARKRWMYQFQPVEIRTREFIGFRQDQSHQKKSSKSSGLYASGKLVIRPYRQLQDLQAILSPAFCGSNLKIAGQTDVI